MTNKIIIIGAGMAGLSVARQLTKKGLDAKVLEAKPYIGGRTYAIDIQGKKIDTGATWIHFPKGNPLTKLAEKFGLTVVKDDYEKEGIALFDAEKGVFIENVVEYLKEAERIKEAAEEYFEVHKGDKKTSDFFKKYIKNKNYTKEALRYITFLYRNIIELDYAEDWDKISLDDEKYITTFKDKEYDDALIVESYGAMVNKLSEGLDIQCSTAVQQIDYSNDTIKIKTNQGVFECEKVIITVPLGVLKANSIEFIPALPKKKQKAINEIPFGVMEKIILTFDKVFWNKEKFTLYFEEFENGYVFPSISDFTDVTGFPTLAIYYTASFARSIAQLSDEEILKQVLTVLEKMYNVQNLKPTHYHISRWSTDPFFNGVYSFSDSPKMEKYIKRLAKPIQNKVFFAGEATSVKGQGYAHGAYLSGIRVAKEIEN